MHPVYREAVAVVKEFSRIGEKVSDTIWLYYNVNTEEIWGIIVTWPGGYPKSNSRFQILSERLSVDSYHLLG